MITIYAKNDQGLVTLNEPQTGCWINITGPTAQEIESVTNLGIPSDYITYPLDLDERARSERENGELLIILRVPVFQGHGSDVPYTTVPLGIILTKNYLLTVCKVESDILRELSVSHTKSLTPAKQERFVLYTFLRTAQKYLSNLREINKTVDILEDKLQLSTRNKELLDLLKYQKSLTFFTTALKSNELMMERLRRNGMFVNYPEDQDLLEDVLTENQQAMEMTSISSNILSSMMDAFASIISNNVNSVMKLLASITIVLSIPIMVSSFYGMNVAHLPVANTPYAFWVILGVSVILTLIVFVLFYKRDWL